MSTSTLTRQNLAGPAVTNDTTTAGDIDRETAEALGGQVMAAAGDLARQESVFLELVGRFDACNAVQYWDGVKSTAHWVSWACSLAVSTARDHVRVARALRTMPATREAFAAGQLTYSKVREITRLVDRLDRPDPTDSAVPADLPVSASAAESPTDPEAPESTFTANPCEESLINLARNSTASQLARSVSSFQALEGTSRRRRERQRVAWVVRGDGNLQMTMVLPPEVGAALVNAIQTAATPPDDPQPGEVIPDDRETGADVDERQRQSADQVRAAACERSRIEAVAEIANHYLASRPEDRSGEDRTVVVLEMSIDAVESASGTEHATEPDHTTDSDQATMETQATEETQATKETPVTNESRNVPAGPSEAPLPPVCRIRGGAAVDAPTAERILCDSSVIGMIINWYGEPLAVGRQHRLATRAQRRALMVRDGSCQYPGCLRRRRLQAHHRRSWLSGGNTDLDNLILLCPWHHTCVHERKITIRRCDDATCPIGWEFTSPDGRTIVPLIAGRDERHPWRPSARNDQRVSGDDRRQSAFAEQAELIATRYAHIGHDRCAEARDVFPPGGGEGFRLADCVDVLFGITGALGPNTTDAADAA